MKYLSILLTCLLCLVGSTALAQWPSQDYHTGTVEMGVQYQVAPDENYSNFGLKYMYQDDPTSNLPGDYINSVYTGEYWSTADGPYTVIGYMDIDDLNIPANSVILEAKAYTLISRGEADATSPYMIGVFRVMKPVTMTALGSLTWNTYDGTNGWSTAGALDTSGDWEDVFGGTGATDYTILSHRNQMHNDWARTLGAGVDSLLAANVEGTNPIDVLPFPEDITMSVDANEGTPATSYHQVIDMTNFVRGIYNKGHVNNGFIIKIMDLDIAGSGEEGTIKISNTAISIRPSRFSVFIKYFTIGDGVGGGGNPDMGHGGMN